MRFSARGLRGCYWAPARVNPPFVWRVNLSARKLGAGMIKASVGGKNFLAKRLYNQSELSRIADCRFHVGNRKS
jgi:hypothetical protein